VKRQTGRHGEAESRFFGILRIRLRILLNSLVEVVVSHLFLKLSRFCMLCFHISIILKMLIIGTNYVTSEKC
jgi:hypothetical protein